MVFGDTGAFAAFVELLHSSEGTIGMLLFQGQRGLLEVEGINRKAKRALLGSQQSTTGS